MEGGREDRGSVGGIAAREKREGWSQSEWLANGRSPPLNDDGLRGGERGVRGWF